jgi:radical SAM protein (TIGR04043 family)
LQGKFVGASPYALVKTNEEWQIFQNTRFITEVKLVPRPRFCGKLTSEGIPMGKVAVLHGKDCLASTIYSKCIYWSSGKQCKFCGIELGQNERLMQKQPHQLGEVAEEAYKERVATHITLTTGTPSGQDKGALMLAEAAREIKQRVNMPVHVQLEPPENKFLQLLYDAGADTVGMHIESFDEEVLKQVCSMKTNLEAYFKAWKTAVELFGDGQVSTFIIAGLGETNESILQGAEKAARIGVIPYVLPLRPIIGTAFENVSPPSPERMTRLYNGVCEILKEYGLDPRKNRAGCIRCGACSALTEAFLYGF